MNTRITKEIVATKRGKTTFLFLLAFLMLVVSCPFKRLLADSSEQQAYGQSPVKWNGAERKIAAYKNTACCLQKQKLTLVKPTISKQEVPAPEFVTVKTESGFSLAYYLSGTENVYVPFTTSSRFSIPLFLQHRRLLI